MMLYSMSSIHTLQVARVLCRDVVSDVYRRQPAAPEGFGRGRFDKGVHTIQAKPEARICVHWHGGSTDKDADSGSGQEAQSRHLVTKYEAAEAAAGRAA